MPATLALLAALLIGGQSPDDTAPAREPNALTEPTLGEPDALSEPTVGEREALIGELALLDRAIAAHVSVPGDAGSLQELLDSLAAQSGIPIEGEWDALVRMGVFPEAVPQLKSGSGSLLSVLESLCLTLGTQFERPRAEVTLSRFRLTSASSAAGLRRTRAYHADTIADEFSRQAIEHIDPDAWTHNGGEVQHMTQIDGTVLVSAPASVHRRLGLLLEELRQTRPMAIEISTEIWRMPRSAYDKIALESGTVAQATSWKKLTQTPGCEHISSPTMVTAVDSIASMKIAHDTRVLSLSFQPEREETGGVKLRFEFSLADGATSISSSGSLPAPMGAPASVVVDLPDSADVIVLRMRGRGLGRSASPGPG